MNSKMYQSIEPEFLKKWQELWKNSPVANYTNSPGWFVSVLETYQYADYVIIALYKKEELVGVAALVKEKRYGVPVYTVAPGDFVCGLPFLVDVNDKKAVVLLQKELLRLGTVCFDNVPQICLELFAAYATARSSEINFYLDITKDEKGFVQIRHKKRLLRRSESIEHDLVLGKYTDCDEQAFEENL